VEIVFVMATEHKHLIIRAEVNNPIFNKSKGVKFLKKIIKKINMKIMYGPVASYCKVKGNKGLTAFAIIETSHVAMHIWDEDTPSLFQLDVYTCGPLDKEIIFQELKDLDPINIEYKYLDREKNLKEIDIEKV
jgi:S-adenosylmethionine/arginine decarboxylase-like enzyme